MQTVHDIATLRDALSPHRRAGARIALVPTMGNLHEGHLRLVDEARAQADVVVATLFVNPLQFAPGEDLDSYPRTLKDDQGALSARHCDLLFVPSVETLYPGGLENLSQVHVPIVSEGLCGGARRGHFDGVATVVSLLFHLVQPDIACFGEKDYQQLAVIRKLVADLHFPIQIVGVPTVRATDGLALSSRNGYLTPAERARAVAFPRALARAATAITAGQPTRDALDAARADLVQAGLTLDYLELRAPDLSALEPATSSHARLLAAVYLGATRLIDNVDVALPGADHG
ncbi:pantoate--beta-alanine ligase [Salinicola aestuarinus]|uniref:pantoate--beta-alanine ligase n=1 Tax=Salinicola aestuarinus TaxID=1949082 RepID=UPI000DA19D18|nr:pantoate--beta-alanine ligase [Salinicola aestuarinus]